MRKWINTWLRTGRLTRKTRACRLASQNESLEPRALLSVSPVLLNSWFVSGQGEFSQVITGLNGGTTSGPGTTWTGQASPVLGDVQKVRFSTSGNYAYVNTPDLASYTMGPWWSDATKQHPFMNFPKDQGSIFRVAYNSTFPSIAHANTAGGPVGIAVNGVVFYSSGDAFSYGHTAGTDVAMGGDGIFNRQAEWAESATFDTGNGHQPGNGQYHYHTNPAALRAQLRDNIDYVGTTNYFPYDPAVYLLTQGEGADGDFVEHTSNLHHSPIIGWMFDGYPIYGPYGYSTAADSASAVTRMNSSFSLRTDLTTGSARISVPGWSAQLDSVKLGATAAATAAGSTYTMTAAQQSLYAGPAVSSTNPLGKYGEDYAYVPGAGHLDQFNGRWCVTPEFPLGTYAYFDTIDAEGEGAFPYIMNRQYYGTLNGSGKVTTISEAVTTAFDISNNTAPVVNGPSTASVMHGGTLSFTGNKLITLSDIDAAATESVTLTISAGTLNVNLSSGLASFATISAGANGSSTLTLSGNITLLNPALATLTCTAPATGNSYTLTVRANDGGAANNLSNTLTTTITLNMVNNPPTDMSLSSSSIAENQPVATAVGTFSTVDPDSGNTFSYSLINGAGSTDNGAFTLSGNMLLTAAVFDYEARSSYSIRVRATDQGLLFSDKIFTILVLNINEVPTAVSLQNAVTTLADFVSTANPVLIANVSVTDDILGTNLLSLAGPDAGFFSIVGSQLFLNAGTALNASTKPTCNFTVAVDDASIGNSPDASVNRQLQISGTTVTILGPSAFTSSQRPIMSWSSVTGAAEYEIWIRNQSTSVNPFLQATSVATTFTPTSDMGIGRYDLWVRAVGPNSEKGAWTRAYTFQINTAAAFLPVQLYQTTATPALTWNSVPGAAKYDLWIDNRGTFQLQFVRNQNLTGTSWTSPAALPMGAYRAWIRAIDAGGVTAQWSLAVDFVVVPTVTPVSPLNPTFDLTPTFTWNPVLGAAGYDLMLKNAGTGVIVSNPQNIIGTNWTPPADLPVGTYRWSVLAVSAAQQRSQAATVVNVHVGGLPTLQTPTGATANRAPRFSWTPVDGAIRYELFVNRIDVPMTGIINLTAITTTSYTPGTLMSPGTYRAWVRAVSATNGAGPWSVSVNFTITDATSVRRGLAGSAEWLLTSLLTNLRARTSVLSEANPLNHSDGPAAGATESVPKAALEGTSVDALMLEFTTRDFMHLAANPEQSK